MGFFVGRDDVGRLLGDPVGAEVRRGVGGCVGNLDGEAVGTTDVGFADDGASVGNTDGESVARSVGDDVGTEVVAATDGGVGDSVVGTSCVVCAVVGSVVGDEVKGLGHKPPASNSGWPFFFTHCVPVHMHLLE